MKKKKGKKIKNKERKINKGKTWEDVGKEGNLYGISFQGSTQYRWGHGWQSRDPSKANSPSAKTGRKKKKKKPMHPFADR